MSKLAPIALAGIATLVVVALLLFASALPATPRSSAGPAAYDPAVAALDVPTVETIHYGNPQTIQVMATFRNDGAATDALALTMEAHYTLDFEASWIGEPGDTVQNAIFDGDFRSELTRTESEVVPGETIEMSRDLTLRCPAPGFNFIMNYYVVASATSQSGEDGDLSDSSMTQYRMVACSGSPPTTPGPTVTPTATRTPGPAPSATLPAKACGDANLDAQVDAIDAQLVLQYVAAVIGELKGLTSADTNGDGSITSTDALLILQYTARLIDEACP